MKSIIFSTVAGAGLFLSACSIETGSDDTGTVMTEDAAGPSEADPASADPDAGAAERDVADAEAVHYESLDETGGEFRFTYGWPAKVSAIPALSAKLTEEREALYAEWSADWNAAKEQAPEDCAPCSRYTYGKEWQVVADTPRYLSLSARVTTYTGGAHGMLVFDSGVYDRETGALLEPVNLFRSAEALSDAVQDAYCRSLDRQRAQKRGGREIGGTFDECIDPVQNSAVILGSAGGQRFDRIGFLIPPYNAGPYAEGSYEVTLSVTPAIMDAVRPEYRRSFQVP